MFTLRFTDVMDTFYLLLNREWNQWRSLEEVAFLTLEAVVGGYVMDGVESYYLL